MVVHGEDFVSQSVAGHLRDAGYTFYRESMLVLGYSRRLYDMCKHTRTHSHTSTHARTPAPTLTPTHQHRTNLNMRIRAHTHISGHTRAHAHYGGLH